MQILTTHILCNGENLILSNQRAVFWKREKMLILSDTHIGKTAHFRKNGIPISVEVLKQDLTRLDALIQYFKPEQLMVVGDLFHAEFNKDVVFFKQWMAQYASLQLLLVKGNHDASYFELYEGLPICIYHNIMNLKPFTFIHHITSNSLDENAFYISGHTHPGVFLKGLGKQRIKLPCFQVSKQQLVLPAFSAFTGLNTNARVEGCTHFAFTEKTIFKV